MTLDELFDNVGKDKLQAAIECGDDGQKLQELLRESGANVSAEQIDYLAGGFDAESTGCNNDRFSLESPATC